MSRTAPNTSYGRRPFRRLLVLGLAAAGLAIAGGCGDAAPEEEESGSQTTRGGQVTIDSWGDDFQKDQTAVLFDPFTKSTGTKVVQLSDAESIYAKVSAQVKRGKGNIDLVHGDASWLVRGERAGLWSEIDYDVVDGEQLYDDARHRYGVGVLYYSYNIVANTEKFPAGVPKTWKEVWDYAKKHPKRVAMWAPRPNYNVEAALMAAGYAPDDVYPLNDAKVDEAFRSLDEIKDKVIWWEGGAEGAKLFSSGQVDVGMYYGADAYAVLTDKGEPIDVGWEQGIYTRDYWLVPANAPNKERAMELINFAISAQRQTEFAERTGYGPVNPASQEAVSEKVRRRLPSVEPNKSAQLSYDLEWWGEHDDEMLKRWNAWLRG